MRTMQRFVVVCLFGCALLALGCGGHPHPQAQDQSDGGTPPGTPSGQNPGKTPGQPSGNPPTVIPVSGATDFVSADQNPAGQSGARSSADAGTAASATGAGAGADSASDPRSVERGDIYRVLGDHRILSLNSYRGVQVIDITDVSAPRIEGRLPITGTPVEMYVVGNRAFVLLNDWQGYYGTRGDVRLQSVQGGLVLSVDISDRANPKLLDQVPVPGNILTSRLTQNQSGTQAALYVAAQQYGTPYSGNTSPHGVLQSFDVSVGKLVSKSSLDLGGYVQDVQATTDVVMVASTDYTQSTQQSTVALVDISSPDGTMTQGAVVKPSGVVRNKFNMDVYNGVLRVVSGSTWSGTNTNHLETFDVHNLSNAPLLDHCTFGDGQSLNATLFIKNQGFFVSYLRRDPLHTFSIDDQGKCQEHAEFVVSGWNDFFRSVGNDTRLIGIGRNDENSTSKLSVSLYDITNIANPNPLLARADIDLTWAYSQGSWDDRGFTVLENVASAKATDGTVETGMVLLPFEGWNSKASQWLAQVQLFTFSDHTLTLRGVMDHGSPVRRSFPTAPDNTANLSEEQLSLFNTHDPDAPKELGRVDVAPNYTEVLLYGSYVARIKNRSYYWGYRAGTGTPAPSTEVQMVPRSADLDRAAPVAAIALPASAQITKVGDLLVSVDMAYVSGGSVQPDGSVSEPSYHSTIDVYDLSDPTAPRKRGTLTTDALQPNHGYWYGGYYGGYGGMVADCISCGGYYGYYGSQAKLPVVGNAIVFSETHSQHKSLGTVHTCTEYPNNNYCTYDSSGTSTCPTTYYQGSITCVTPQGGTESCTGEFVVCDDKGACTSGTPALGTNRNCYDYEQIRYWSSFSFDILDLTNPDAPVFAPHIEMPADQEGTSVYTDQSGVYFNYQKPTVVNHDPRPAVKHYFTPIDLSDPGHPVVGTAVNIPGDVIATQDDIIYTRDMIWNDQRTETMVARLHLSSGLAHLQASRLFAQRQVTAVELDGAGHMLASHDPAWNYYYYYASSAGAEARTHRLSILDVNDLSVLGETEVDAWATFVTAKAGKAVYAVSGGLLLLNVQDPASPFAQAYFPTMGWSTELLLDQNEILLAAGPYGVYRFGADTYNLLSK